MTAAVLPDLRTVPLEELQALYLADTGSEVARMVLRECARRDRLDTAKRRRDAEVNAWRIAVEAAYLAADAECRGNLVSRAGIAAGIATEIELWSGPERQARRFASEELCQWWDRHGRLTITQYRKQQAAMARVARDDRDWAQWDREVSEPEPVSEWEALPDGGRVRESHVTAGGERVTAWWGIDITGKATLHRDRAAAVTAAAAVRRAVPRQRAVRVPDVIRDAAGVTTLAPVPAGRYAAAVATRNGSRVTVRDLGEFAGHLAAMAACRRAAGQALTWERRNMTQFGARTAGAGFFITRMTD